MGGVVRREILRLKKKLYSFFFFWIEKSAFPGLQPLGSCVTHKQGLCFAAFEKDVNVWIWWKSFYSPPPTPALRDGLTAPGWRMCLSQVLCHPGNHGDHDDRLDAIWSQPHKKKAADGNQATRPVSREKQRKRAKGRKEGRKELSTEAALEMDILEKSGTRNRKPGKQEGGKRGRNVKNKHDLTVRCTSVVTKRTALRQLSSVFTGLGCWGARAPRFSSPRDPRDGGLRLCLAISRNLMHVQKNLETWPVLSDDW